MSMAIMNATIANDNTVRVVKSGLVIPKRKISSHFRCPTCQKIYLGRNRMARHFEMYPDHGNIDQIHVPSQTQANLGVGDTKAGLSGLNGVVRRGRGRGRLAGFLGGIHDS
uniref:DUF4764 domain-containing protein n=1 Tax=Timema poppense TaxID=170557 RepID=A0A7R9DCV6_TIMPO|nr:unnamed protein product [Timema poppensis]